MSTDRVLRTSTAMTQRLPWEIVETLPSTDADLLAHWSRQVVAAEGETTARVTALVGRALASYWAVQEGVVDQCWEDMARARAADVEAATGLARTVGDADSLATALLGMLYACWGPDHRTGRAEVVAELRGLGDRIQDPELRLRALEWEVLDALDHGDLDGARGHIDCFAQDAAGTGLGLFLRRRELWEANLAMLEGRIDESLRANQDAISSTAEVAGSPFSFQNVAITLAIERFLRRGLGDLVEAIRSIRASSPRVASNWDVGLAFALAECGELDEAGALFEAVAIEDFTAVPRDLNWLVTMQLLSLIALHLDDHPRMTSLYDQLLRFGDLDATHGSGYASYGPVARVLGAMAARLGSPERAEAHFEDVLGSRAPGPWTSLTRLDRARAMSVADPEAAHGDAVRAADEMAEMGMDAWAGEARQVAQGLQLDGHGPPLALLMNSRWRLVHPTGTAELAAGVGVDQLVELLAKPGSPVEAIALDHEADASLPRDAPNEMSLDVQARRSYRRRLREMEEAPGALSPAQASEADFLRGELVRASFVSSSSAELEKARVRVTKSVRRTLDAVGAASPGLGAYLGETVSTGRRLLYDPSDAVAWQVRREGRAS